MSSIEKAIERLIAKNQKQKNDDGFGVVEDIDKQMPATKEAVTPVPVNRQKVEAEPVVETAPLNEDKPETIVSQSTARNVVDDREKKICHLDFTQLDHAGYLVPDTKRQRLSEEYRIIKRPVLMNAFGQGAAPVEHGNLVSVTSSTAGEGKTYTSLNLAISIAMELDTTILLIDSDIIKTSLSRLLGVEKEPGLMDVLRNPDCDLSDVILATDLPRLKILPAGNTSRNPTELLASSRMRSLVKEISERYSDRIILFDAPPLLETTEASVIAGLMGQVLVVVEAGGARTDNIEAAVKVINPEKVIGMILNKNRYASSSNYYGGYYNAEEIKDEVFGD